MTALDTGDIRLNVERLGPQGESVETVVLIHGIATDNLTSYYFTVAPEFAAAGYDVVMYDQRGHGRSERPEQGYGVEEFTEDLRSLLDTLGLTGRPVHLVGNSFGGTVALDFALHHPERVASVLMVESEPPTDAWARKMSGLLAGSAHQLHDARTLPWIEEKYGRHEARLVRWSQRLLHHTSICADIAASRIPEEPRWRALTTPVFAIYGANSDLAEMAPWLSALLPNCRTERIEGHGHAVLIGAPEAIAPRLLGWLRETSPGPTPRGSAPDPAAQSPQGLDVPHRAPDPAAQSPQELNNRGVAT
ncbi:MULTISPECIES: alpha/beta fold hydrolase [unclassified Streptomyces]|uniref:alpha/beta fold hydrolase n=1 Tax=unclassified Streptomyces TaxID=2593676 RepID=UPI00278C2DCB|nr:MULTISPECIES: alpha/beta hydrolase [unclassified Streptomyces]